jgi:hypothetical protein
VGTKRIKPGKARTGHLTRMSPARRRTEGWKRGEAPSPRILLGRTTQAIGWRTVIGYANQPGKADQLTQVDADVVATELDEITTALCGSTTVRTTVRTAELSRI